MEQKQHRSRQQLQSASGFSGLFSLFAYIVVLLAQNPDWGHNRLLWWGSVGIFVLLFLVEKNGILALDHNYTAWTVAFMGICVASYFWAVSTGAVTNIMKALIVNTVVLILLRSSVKNEEDVERILRLILFVVVINSVWVLLTNRSIFDQTVSQDEFGDRLGSDSKWNANDIGMMAATAMLIALYWRKKTNNAMMRWICVIAVPLMILTVLLSGSRKALLMALMGFCGFVFLTAKGKRIRSVFVIILAVLVLYYLVMEVPFFYSIVGMRVEGFIASLTGVGEVDSSTQVREAMRIDAMRVWRERPILGYGLNCYQAIGKVKPGIYSHNNYTEMLANLGIVGTVIYYSAHLYCLIGLLRIKKKDSLVWLLLLVLLIQLVMDYGCVSYTSLLDGMLRMLTFCVISIRRSAEKAKNNAA